MTSRFLRELGYDKVSDESFKNLTKLLFRANIQAAYRELNQYGGHKFQLDPQFADVYRERAKPSITFEEVVRRYRSKY